MDTDTIDLDNYVEKLSKQDIGGDILTAFSSGYDLGPALEEAVLSYAGHKAITEAQAKLDVGNCEKLLTAAKVTQEADDIRVFLKDTFPPRDASEVNLRPSEVPNCEADLAIAKRKAIGAGKAGKQLGIVMARHLKGPDVAVSIVAIYDGLWNAVNGDHDDLTHRVVVDMRATAVSGLPLIQRLYIASIAEGVQAQELKALRLAWGEFPQSMPTLSSVRHELYGKHEESQKAAESEATQKAATKKAANAAGAAMAASGRLAGETAKTAKTKTKTTNK